MKFFYYLYLTIAYLFVKLVYPCHVTGRENIPSEGPLVVCANHSSLMDPIMIAVYFGYKHQVFFMAKAELFQIPILSGILRSAGVFPVQRGETDIGAIRTAMKHLKSGDIIMLFPEGKRVAENESVAAKAGAVRIAAKVKAPILPVWLTSGKKAFRHSEMVIGKPFSQSLPYGRNYEPLINELMENIYILEPKK